MQVVKTIVGQIMGQIMGQNMGQNMGQSIGLKSVYLGTAAALMMLGGCATGAPQVTHHWVSQDKVAGNVYRNDVADCSSGVAELRVNSEEFSAYQACMKDRGYSLVAESDLRHSGL